MIVSFMSHILPGVRAFSYYPTLWALKSDSRVRDSAGNLWRRDAFGLWPRAKAIGRAGYSAGYSVSVYFSVRVSVKSRVFGVSLLFRESIREK